MPTARADCRVAGDVVEERGHDMMRYVASAKAFVEPTVIGVHVAAGGAVFIRGFYVVEEFREGVVARKEEPPPNRFSALTYTP